MSAKNTGGTTRLAAAATAALTAISLAGCFPQTAEQQVNCDELRNMWAQSQADMREAMRGAVGDPERMARDVGAVASRLKTEAETLRDDELSAAMKAVATDLENMAAGFGGSGGGLSMPPLDGLMQMNNAMDRKCPA